jgi:UrcA family protein
MLLVAIAASPLNAFAESPGFDQPPARVVRYGDLDLNQKSGVITLYGRIRTAAREVCEPIEDISIKLLRAKYDCRHDATARAVAEVNSPALTDYFADRSGAAAGRTR